VENIKETDKNLKTIIKELRSEIQEPVENSEIIYIENAEDQKRVANH